MATKLDDELGTAHSAERYWRFWVLVIGILFFFGCHNYMQELIMTLPGFKVIVFDSFLANLKICALRI